MALDVGGISNGDKTPASQLHLDNVKTINLKLDDEYLMALESQAQQWRDRWHSLSEDVKEVKPNALRRVGSAHVSGSSAESQQIAPNPKILQRANSAPAIMTGLNRKAWLQMVNQLATLSASKVS